MRTSGFPAQDSCLTPSRRGVRSAHWPVTKSLFSSLSLSPPPVTARRSSDTLLVRGQHLVAEIIQGPGSSGPSCCNRHGLGLSVLKRNLVAGRQGLQGVCEDGFGEQTGTEATREG